MPVHNWPLVPDYIFDGLRLSWDVTLSRRLNNGVLPSDYYVLKERIVPEVERWLRHDHDVFTANADDALVVRRAKNDEPVSVLQILTREQKRSKAAVESFLEKIDNCFKFSLNYVFVDLTIAGEFDPGTLHWSICDHVGIDHSNICLLYTSPSPRD